MGRNFKFQAQDSVLEYFLWRLEDLKSKPHFLKKGTFSTTQNIHIWASTELQFQKIHEL